MTRNAKIWLAVIIITVLGAAGIIYTVNYYPKSEKNALSSGSYTDESGRTVMKAGAYDIWFTVPSGWEEQETENLDFLCQSSNMGLGMFVYDKSNFMDDITVRDVLASQNYELFSKRDGTEHISSEEIVEDGKYIICEVITAQREGYEKNKYCTYAIDFTESDYIAWVCINGLPDEIDGRKQEIRDIISSFTVNAPKGASYE